MGEHDDRRRSALTPQIVGEPGELVGAEIAHAARFEIDDIDEADEMDAGLVEGIPARALGAFAITVEIGFPLGLVDDVMFARHVVNVEPGLADDLIGVVELLGLRQMRDVAGMDHERRLGRHGDDLADRFPQRAERIGIGRLVETDMAVGNLQETEPRLGRLRRSDQRRFRHAAGERPYHAGSRPDHTFERLAAVESFILTMRHLASPRPALCRSRRRLGVRRDYSRRADLFFRAVNRLSARSDPPGIAAVLAGAAERTSATLARSRRRQERAGRSRSQGACLARRSSLLKALGCRFVSSALGTRLAATAPPYARAPISRFRSAAFSRPSRVSNFCSSTCASSCAALASSIWPASSAIELLRFSRRLIAARA